MSRIEFDYSNLRQVFLQATIIVCFGVGVGLTFNYPLLTKAFDSEPAVTTKLFSDSVVVQEPRSVTLTQVEQLKGKALRIDARITELYAEGHLPGAVSLPYAEIDDKIDAFISRVPTDEPLIIYCSGYGCPDSFDLALALQAEGFDNVRIFEGGYPQWRDAGNPVEADLP
jgi:rhodanese-related sulfurtransferase